MATVVSFGGLWFVNPCRVVYSSLEEDPNVAAYAYGTLSGHVECGEERFSVSYSGATGEVRYVIAAFSRPAIVLTKLAYPLVRRIQRRFAVHSARALSQAAA